MTRYTGTVMEHPEGGWVAWEDVAVLIEELSLTNDHEHAILGERDEARKCVAELEAQLSHYYIQKDRYRAALGKVVKSDTGEFGMAGSLYLCRDCQNKEDIAREALEEI